MSIDPITRTVSEMAALTGVTVRTLHHYDELELLVPSERGEGRRRLYTNADLARLREILTWRRLGVPLKEIGPLLDDPSADRITVLRAQRSVVAQRHKELTSLAEALDAAIDAECKQKENSMSNTDKAIIEALDGFDPAEYEAEAEARWGTTDAFKQSAARTKSYSAEDWREIKSEIDAIFAALAALFTSGVAPDDAAALDASEQHRAHISKRFYDCSPEFHAGLGAMYVSDPRFTTSLEKDGELAGFAEWLSEAFAAAAQDR